MPIAPVDSDIIVRTLRDDIRKLLSSNLFDLEVINMDNKIAEAVAQNTLLYTEKYPHRDVPIGCFYRGETFTIYDSGTVQKSWEFKVPLDPSLYEIFDELITEQQTLKNMIRKVELYFRDVFVHGKTIKDFENLLPTGIHEDLKDISGTYIYHDYYKEKLANKEIKRILKKHEEAITLLKTFLLRRVLTN